MNINKHRQAAIAFMLSFEVQTDIVSILYCDEAHMKRKIEREKKTTLSYSKYL